jgi:hypothetical protein
MNVYQWTKVVLVEKQINAGVGGSMGRGSAVVEPKVFIEKKK